MSNHAEIKSEKILIKNIFSQKWFRIPEYQRPYVWGPDEIGELLEDIAYAMRERGDDEYFLGSFVYQMKSSSSEQKYDENDLLDGQQRMTSILILLAVIRDITDEQGAKRVCQESIYQQANEYTNIPEQTRLTFAIRENSQKFIDEYIKPENGTNKEGVAILASSSEDSTDISTINMAKAVLKIKEYFTKRSDIKCEKFLQYLLNKVLMIYVATENLEDAFRLFTILGCV